MCLYINYIYTYVFVYLSLCLLFLCIYKHKILTFLSTKLPYTYVLQLYLVEERVCQSISIIIKKKIISLTFTYTFKDFFCFLFIYVLL